MFGKTNVPRWSGDLQTYNEMFGTTNNPWDLTRTPGGSSGGAATAVASGFTSFELGTDIGGSVRMPAHLCGIFGLKPTYGIVSQRGYLDSVGGGTTDADINAFGPLARSADDLDLLLQITAGPNTTDAAAWSLQLPPSTTKPLNALRIGVWLDGDGTPPLADDVRAVIENAISALSDAGVHIERVHPSIDFAKQRDLFFHLLTAATSPSMPYGDHDASGSHLEWLRAQQARAALAASWRQWFDTFDALLCPVMTTAAFEHDNEIDFLSRTLTINGLARPHTDCVAWTGLIGVVGLPAAVPPIGRTAQGLPVGVQVVTAPYHDREAIRIAKLVSETCDGGYVVPPLMA